MLYPNYRLDLKVEVADEPPRLSGRRVLGEGGEGIVYSSTYWQPDGRRVDAAVKAFHQPDVASASTEEEKLFALTTIPMVVATNCRWVDAIYGRDEILHLVNAAQAQLENCGVGSSYHLGWLRKSYFDFRRLNLAGFTNYIVGLLRQKGLEYPEALDRGTVLSLREDFKGGLASYINGLVMGVNRRWPSLGLPRRIFPEIPLFGIVRPRDLNNDLGDYFENRPDQLFMIMEFVPGSLQRLINRGLEEHLNGYVANSGERLDVRILKGVVEYVSGHAPLGMLVQVQTMLHILGSLWVVFTDLKPENIGFDTDGKVVLLDPGTAVYKGEIQDFATAEYLPEREILDGEERFPLQEYQDGVLRAHPLLDRRAFEAILQNLVSEGMTATIQATQRNTVDFKRADRLAHVTSRALKSRGSTKGVN